MAFSSLRGRAPAPAPVAEAPSPAFSHELISDAWFRSHFVHAADEVHRWLAQAIDVRASRIVDFGCGDGIMALGMALRHRAREVVGADLHDAFKYLPDTARAQIGLGAMPANLRFARIAPGESLRAQGPIDAVYSWSVFEHVDRALLPGVLADIFAALAPGGIFFLQIEPLYFSAFGSHLSGLISEPWVHLRCSREQLWARIDGTKVEDMKDKHKNKVFELCSFDDFKAFLKREFESLNKLTIAELLALAQQAGFVIEKARTWKARTIFNVMRLAAHPSLLSRHRAADLACNEVKLLLRKP